MIIVFDNNKYKILLLSVATFIYVCLVTGTVFAGDCTLRVPLRNWRGSKAMVEADELTHSKTEISEILSRLNALKKRDSSEITDSDRRFIYQVATYYGYYPDLIKNGSIEQDKALIVLSIISSAELVSLANRGDVSEFAAIALDEIGTIYFAHAHELNHIIRYLVLVRDFVFDPSISDNQDLYDLAVRLCSENIAWRGILNNWEGLGLLTPNFVVGLIDKLIEHVEEVLQATLSIDQYIEKTLDNKKLEILMGKTLFEQYSEEQKKSKGECKYNLLILKKLKQDILQSRRRYFVDIVESLKEALKSFQDIKKVNIELHIDGIIPNLYVNPVRLAHIWINMIRNAKDAIYEAKREDGIIDISVSLANIDNYEFIEIKISDNGIGISNEFLRDGRLFKMGETTKSTGTGRGLYIIDQTVKSLNGTIDVKSERGKGTTFTITLPVLNKQSLEEIITPQQEDIQTGV